MLNENQQLKQMLETSHQPLIIFGGEKSDDAVAAAIALRLFFKKQNKPAEVAASDFAAPKRLSFLPETGAIKPALSHLQKFILKVDVSKTKLDALSYDIKDGWLSIYLTPKEGRLTKNELRTAQTGFRYDLIIALGSPDFNSLGDIFHNNTDLFYRLPLINIDHRTGNEHYGQLNLVDLTATSLSEIVFNILEKEESAIDETIATCLLTGMMSQTNGFKTANVTPETLNRAGRLMVLGADREKIVRHLYRTRSVAALKLWGQALANLQYDRATGLVWATLTRESFTRAGAEANDLKDLNNELIAGSPEAKICLLLFENPDLAQGGVRGWLTTGNDYDARQLVSNLQPFGDKKTAGFLLNNKNLKEAEEITLEEIRKKITR